MREEPQGITWVELMIIALIVSVLAAIIAPNFIAMQIRKHEGNTKANMHWVQLACEDLRMQQDGVYSTNPDTIMRLVKRENSGQALKNAFTGAPLKIWGFDQQPTVKLPPGDIALYTPAGRTKGSTYVVQGVMHDSTLSELTLTAGQ